MADKIKVGAVSYLNTKPLLYGLSRPPVIDYIELSTAYPSQLARQLRDGEIDVALLPVAAMQEIPGAHIVSDYGIAAEANVVSVAVFSQVPMAEIEEVILDYQSRTSVRLTRLLFEEHWKKPVRFIPASENFIGEIRGNRAGVIIGDRALQQLPNFPYNYDLSKAWTELTGLPFVFAAWVANKPLPEDFIDRFNEANRMGLDHIDEIADQYAVPYYSLKTYYNDNICYRLDAEKRKGLALFLEKIKE
ncbi:menaquinone biosynthesis protein [Rurimicrobium arvi]|uniref:menaquinone biosynthetic enzyme MqnA/MqnD family protein n=1 Tax=Rurimicrobium arvi TaxID=2049916 RepID=UPI0031CF34B5